MSTTQAYLLGLSTLPALAGIGLALLWLYVRLAQAMTSRGWFVEISLKSHENWPSSVLLMRDPWFERQRGPFFAGHWCRDNVKWDGERDEVTHTPVLSRWVGVGKSRGRGIYVGRQVTL